jgi:glutamyl-Q tRNA(Asp) synthetase
MSLPQENPIFRFAPSPNGHLHLGHAYSALLNFDMAKELEGQFLLRVEDIDITRCNPVLEEQMLADLLWLGISWEGEPRRQSDHFADYQAALDALEIENLIYPAFMSRGDRARIIAEHVDSEEPWPCDPDGVPHYPDHDRNLSVEERQLRIDAGKPYAFRLDMSAACDRVNRDLNFMESGSGPEGQSGQIVGDPHQWGDVLLGRKEIPTSYHLSVIVDDALQGITHVVRGRDLFHTTSVHRLLQELLGLSPPLYHHHDLILADDGRKLSKSAEDTSIRSLRDAGATPADIRRMVGL